MKHGRNIHNIDFIQLFDSHTPSFREILFIIS